MPTYSRPLASAMAVIRAAMARPPVLGSTLRPNAAARGLRACASRACASKGSAMRSAPLRRVGSGSVLGDPGQCPGQQVLLAGGQAVQQPLPDGLRVDHRRAAEHIPSVRADADEDAAPVPTGVGPSQPAAAFPAGD